MKVIWDERDVVMGRRILCGEAEAVIGFMSGGEKDKNYCIISLTDGSVGKRGTKADVALQLTEGDYEPVTVDRTELRIITWLSSSAGADLVVSILAKRRNAIRTLLGLPQ